MKIRFIKPFRFIGNAPDDGSDGTAPVGYVVDLENDESAQWLIDNGFAEEVKESGWWEPECGKRYYYIDGSGYIAPNNWEHTGFDAWRHDIGNCFKTYEAAGRYRDYLEAVAAVRHDEGFMKKDNARFVYPIVAHNNLRVVSAPSSSRQHAGEFYFDSYEHSNASLDKHRDEWQTILNYDWSKE